MMRIALFVALSGRVSSAVSLVSLPRSGVQCTEATLGHC